MPHDPFRDGRRRHARISFICESVPVVVERGAESVRHIMSARDLSAGGIGLIFAAPLPPGTSLRITLKRRNGIEVEVRGTVRHSSPLSPDRYALGVQFEGLIKPLEFANR